MRLQVQVNRQVVALPYKKYGLQVYESGISFVVDIPELGALISYNGLSFSIRLPFRLFGSNTKGQCGEPAAPPALPWGLGARSSARRWSFCLCWAAVAWSWVGSCGEPTGGAGHGGPGLGWVVSRGRSRLALSDGTSLPPQAPAPTALQTTACCPAERSSPTARPQLTSGW